MTADHGDQVVVIVAAVDGAGDVATCLKGFLDEVDGRGRVLLLDGTTDGRAGEAALAFGAVEVLRRPAGSLAPELWRDGIRASSEPLIALTTSQMMPGCGWLDAMLSRLTECGAAAVGGPIEPLEADPIDLHPLDKAVYLLRYFNYRRPLRQTTNLTPPGDNAIYRRDALENLTDPIDRGFWEAEIHRILRDRDERLVFAPNAPVMFCGGSRPRPLIRQRFLHAWHYGSGRARRFGLGQKVARTALAPLVPCLMLGRIVAAIVEKGVLFRPWLPSLPWLLPLLGAWSLGEVLGTWLAPPHVHSFPRSAWECRPGRSASAFPRGKTTQSVADGIPTETVGTREGRAA